MDHHDHIRHDLGVAYESLVGYNAATDDPKRSTEDIGYTLIEIIQELLEDLHETERSN